MTDVFLCAHRRTPIGRYGGVLASVRPDDLAARVIEGLLDLHDLPVDEVVFGCANQAGEDNRNVARMAVLLSRLGETVPAVTVNRLAAAQPVIRRAIDAVVQRIPPGFAAEPGVPRAASAEVLARPVAR